MDWNLANMTGPVATGWNVDRLVTVEIKSDGRPGRGLPHPQAGQNSHDMTRAIQDFLFHDKHPVGMT